MKERMSFRKYPLVLLLIVMIFWVWSGISPEDTRLTWILETFPFFIAVPLAFSALYEIIEWLASLSNPADTEAFLGTQGYIWDTQTDMFFCLIGSVVAVVLLTKLHNKYLSGIRAE